MPEKEQRTLYYTAPEACVKAAEVGVSVSLATLLTWVAKNNLGFQPAGTGGRWLIYRAEFDAFIDRNSSAEGSDASN